MRSLILHNCSSQSMCRQSWLLDKNGRAGSCQPDSVTLSAHTFTKLDKSTMLSFNYLSYYDFFFFLMIAMTLKVMVPMFSPMSFLDTVFLLFLLAVLFPDRHCRLVPNHPIEHTVLWPNGILCCSSRYGLSASTSSLAVPHGRRVRFPPKATHVLLISPPPARCR